DAKSHSLLASAKSHTDLITASSVSADSKTFATSSRDGSVRLWHAHTGAELFALWDYTGAMNVSVVFSPTGKQLASGGAIDQIAIWQTEQSDALPERSDLVASWKERPADREKAE